MMRKDTRHRATSIKRSPNTTRRIGGVLVATHEGTSDPTTEAQTEIATDKYPGMG
jgi:hypothetical protein